MSGSTHSQSLTASEVAVRSLRILMMGYQLWGGRSATDLSSLAAMLRLSGGELTEVVAELVDAGLVHLDQDQRVVLTRAGVRAMELEPPSLMM